MNEIDKTSLLVNHSMLIAPRHNALSAWTGHVPFAGWLMQTLKPRVFVELGTHLGMSYFTFCQSAKEGNIDTRCYAVDTWEGDAHAGSYTSEIFNEIVSHNEEHYNEFSRLIRQKFDDASVEFSDGSIDLLHIDGFHTYEAVSHDFQTWKSKLSETAVVLFHDINVRDSGFGVWRFWEEVTKEYPHFSFDHFHGLGVLLVGKKQKTELIELCGIAGEKGKIIKSLYARLGDVPSLRYQLGQAARKIQQVEDLNIQAAGENARLSEANKQLEIALSNTRAEVERVHASKSWKITSPLRKLIKFIKN